MSTFTATAYGPPWGGIQGQGVTATGIDLTKAPARYVVAVDPSVIKLGSKLKIWPNPFGDPNIVFTAGDTGGAIKGNRIDFYDWRGRKTQVGWGVRAVKVTALAGAVAESKPSGGAHLATPTGGSAGPTPKAGGGSFDLFSNGDPLLYALLFVVIVGAGATLGIFGLNRALGGAPARAAKKAGVTRAAMAAAA